MVFMAMDCCKHSTCTQSKAFPLGSWYALSHSCENKSCMSSSMNYCVSLRQSIQAFPLYGGTVLCTFLLLVCWKPHCFYQISQHMQSSFGLTYREVMNLEVQQIQLPCIVFFSQFMIISASTVLFSLLQASHQLLFSNCDFLFFCNTCSNAHFYLFWLEMLK